MISMFGMIERCAQSADCAVHSVTVSARSRVRFRVRVRSMLRLGLRLGLVLGLGILHVCDVCAA